MEYTIVNGELYHHGIKGQKWGVRRYQNADGTLTNAGKRRYGSAEAFEAHQKLNQAFNKAYNHNHPYSLSKKRRQESQKRWDEAGDKAEQYRKAKSEYKNAMKDARKKAGLSDKQKKALKKAAKVGAVAAGVALAAYGGYRLNAAIGDKNYARNMASARKAVKSINDKMVNSYMSSDPYKVALDGDDYLSYLRSSQKSAEKQLMSSVSRKKNFDANKFVEDYNPMNYDRYRKIFNSSHR